MILRKSLFQFIFNYRFLYEKLGVRYVEQSGLTWILVILLFSTLAFPCQMLVNRCAGFNILHRLYVFYGTTKRNPFSCRPWHVVN